MALVVGGQDRGIDYAPAREGAVAAMLTPTYVLTLPDNGPRIGAEIQAAAGQADSPAGPGLAAVTDCPDLDAAVGAGFRWARPDGVVLLSPAAPSFGRFRDYVRARRSLRPRHAHAGLNEARTQDDSG